MAIIKLNDSFANEVKDFRDAGEALDTENIYKITKGELSLPTVDAYLERLNKIWKVMIKLKFLVNKDAADIDALAGNLRTADGSPMSGDGGYGGGGGGAHGF